MSLETNYVAGLLTRSVSPLESVRNEALKTILELELNEAFLTTLLDVATSTDAELSKLALIVLKNSICKIYPPTKRRLKPISTQHKLTLSQFKAKIVNVLELRYDAKSAVVPKGLCIIIRTICKHQTANEWPELYDMITSNMEALRNYRNDTKLLNVVLVVYHVLKELRSLTFFGTKDNHDIAFNLFVGVFKFWLAQYTQRWKEVDSPEAFRRLFDELQLRLSVWMDALIVNFLSTPQIHKPLETIASELMLNMSVKLSILVRALACDNTNLVRKDVAKTLKGFARVVEKNPLALVFVDLSPLINTVLDLARGGSDDLANEAIKVLIAMFSSHEMNNEKFARLYFEQVERVQKVDTDVAPITQPASKQELDVTTVPYHKTIDEMRASNPGRMLDGTDGLMELQLTLSFYKALRERGGVLALLYMLRERHIKLDAATLAEWNEDPFPMNPPSRNLAPELVASMNISLVEVFNSVFNAITTADAGDFLNYDTFLQLYTICFKEFYKFHSTKHFTAILARFAQLTSLPHHAFTTLLAFRLSRVLNAWCKKTLLTHEAKAEILGFLLRCVCAQNSEALRVQHVVPLHNLYTRTKDEPMWPQAMTGPNVENLIRSLASVVRVNIPVVRARALELICNVCLEYEEDGHSLATVMALYNQLHSVEVCEAVLNTLLDFVGTLDWAKCYADADALNPSFVLFAVGVINSTVKTDAAGIAGVARHSLVDELFLVLWLSFLRVLPGKITQPALLPELFRFFGPLVDYLSTFENLGEPTVHNTTALKLVTEYVALLGSCHADNREYAVERTAEGEVFRNAFTAVSLTKLYGLCAVASGVGDVNLQDQHDMIAAVFHTFGVPQHAHECYALLNSFFEALEGCARATDGGTHAAALTADGKSTAPQPMRLKREATAELEKLMPAVSMIGHKTGLLPEYLRLRGGANLEAWVNERLLTLVNLSNLLRFKTQIQFGIVQLCVIIIAAVPNAVYPLMQVTRVAEGTDRFDLGWDRAHVHEGRQGIFVLSYLLRVVSDACARHKLKYAAISNEKVEGRQLPPSNRLEWLKDRALTNATAAEPGAIFEEALRLTLAGIVEAARRLPGGLAGLLLAESERLDHRVREALAKL